MKPAASRPQRAKPAMTDLRQLRTRKALRAALLALLERKPFSQITIRDIALQAEIGYATFFRHHPAKEALLEEIAADEVRRLMQLAVPLMNPADTLASCRALCEYVGAHRQVWSALLTGDAAIALRAEFVRLAAASASHIRTNQAVPIDLGAAYGVAATIEILAWWLRQPEGKYSVDEVATFVDSLVVAPALAGGRKAATQGRTSRVRRR